jgi:diacylglycerol kinase (ATP)
MRSWQAGSIPVNVRCGARGHGAQRVRLGVFNNRLAGGGGAQMGDHATRVVEWLRGRGDIPHVETDLPSIRDGLAELAAQGVDVLVVNGGDGTLQRVLTEILSDPIFEHVPMIAPLRSGRTNMSALDIGSRHDTVRSLVALLDAVADGTIARRIVQRPVLRVEMVDEGRPQYGMFCGFGIIHRAIELTHRVFPPGRAQGVFGSSIMTAALVTRVATGSNAELLLADEMDIRLDGEEVPHRFYKLILASTLERFFLGIRPFWGNERAPIHFTAVADRALGIGPAISILRGRRPRRADVDPRFVSRNVHNAELSVRCGLTVDGELFGPRPGRIVRVSAYEGMRFVRSDA